MNNKQILIGALIASAFAPGLSYATVENFEPGMEFNVALESADAGDAAGERKVVRAVELKSGANFVANLDHASMAGLWMLPHGKVVKNAPYSAEVVNEQQQTLADGNQIVKKQTSVSYRDSAGRTRQEVRDPSGAVKRVTINDPVEGAIYTLNPETKTATKRVVRQVANLAADKARAMADERRKERIELRLEKAEGKLADGERDIIIKRVERAEGAANARIHENVRIQVLNNLEGKPMPGLERLENLGPLISGVVGESKWASKSTTRDLGTKEIEGVKATGKMRSYEIPAGEIGNRNAIVVTNESWYSPDLQVTMLTKRSDPRIGDKIYRLASVKRDEPAAALFAIPSDYTVKDATINIRTLDKRAEGKKMEEKK